MPEPSVMPRGALLTGATAVLTMIGYAFYFDYQRRTDPEFRKQLTKRAKKQKKDAKLKEENEKKEKASDIALFLTNELAKAPAIPANPEMRQPLFLNYLEDAERLANTPGQELASAAKFYQALSMYPKPADLLNIYQSSVPKSIYDNLMLMIVQVPPSNMVGILQSEGIIESSANDVE